jgi:parallel beta-helix repeat protein
MNDLSRKVLAIGVSVLLFGASGLVFFKVSMSALGAGGTVYVDDDNVSGPWDGTVLHPYQNITSGLGYASDGDTVLVLGGMYNENVVVNKSVTLHGDSKPIVNGSSLWGTIFVNVSRNFAYGVTVDGFEVLLSAHGVGSGINVDVSGIEDLNGSSVDIGDIVVANNTVNSNSTGIFAYVGQVGYNMYGNSSVTIGGFSISNNTINSAGNGIEVEFTDLGSNMYNSSSFMMGSISINSNLLSNMGIDCGFSYWGYNLHQNSVFLAGNIEINGNTVNNSSYGVNIGSLSEFGYELHDQSSFTMGHVLVNDNNIDSSNEGILVNGLMDLGVYMYGDSIFTMGDIQLNNNTISSSGEGIYIYEFYMLGCYMQNNSRFVMGNVLLNHNVINSSTAGIWFGYPSDDPTGYLGTDMYGNSSFVMGNIEFSGNEVDSLYDGIYLDVFREFGYGMYNNSMFTMGNIRVNDNTIFSGEQGIDAEGFDYFGDELYDDSSFSMSDIEFCRNTVNSTGEGVYISYFSDFGSAMNQRSTFKMDDILVNSNTIYSDSYGINVESITLFGGNGMYGASSFVMGDIEFSGNEIVSGDNGIRIYEITDFGYYMYDDTRFTMGSILLNDNVISSGWYGIIVYNIRHFGERIHGNSSVLMNNIEFCRNVINSTIDALGFGNIRNFGTYMYDNSSFSMGNVLVNDNTLYSYIWLTSFGTFGAYLYDNSSCAMGNVEFGRNLIYAKGADGITFYDLQPFGYEMYNYSLFCMGDFSVYNNVITSDGSHSGITCSEGSGGFDMNVYDNASALVGDFEFAGNDISFTYCGLSFYTVRDAVVRNNTVWNNAYGVYLSNSGGNCIYHNNFVNNTIQTYVTFNYTNTWDNGYPSGGNYWSDYTDVDNSKGQYQNETGSDGIWDHPYVINANNTDRYPFANQYDGISPTIGIPSRTPSGDVLPYQAVTVAVNVTDDLSGVLNVTLYYSIDNGLNWNSTEMLKNVGTGLYEANIPGQEYGKTVRFKIEAFDNAGNNQTRDGVETYCVYPIVPELALPFAFVTFIITTLLSTIILNKKKRRV